MRTLVPAYGIVLAYLASEDDHLVDRSRDGGTIQELAGWGRMLPL